MIKTVIWDFNGTVLDDCAAAVAAVNAMLRRRGLAEITRDWYTRNLEMPLERFYRKVGIERETIEALSAEFQQDCAGVERPVFPEVLETLEALRRAGVRQLLFSSLNHGLLVRQAEERGITPYFETIVGRADQSLGSKSQALRAYLEKEQIPPETALVVGDLTTDWELARFVGAACALIPKGHQHISILQETGAVILKDASEIPKLITE